VLITTDNLRILLPVPNPMEAEREFVMVVTDSDSSKTNSMSKFDSNFISHRNLPTFQYTHS